MFSSSFQWQFSVAVGSGSFQWQFSVAVFSGGVQLQFAVGSGSCAMAVAVVSMLKKMKLSSFKI